MTIDDLVDDLIAREGGYQEAAADRGNAGGYATNMGVTAKTLGEWRRLGRNANKREIKALTVDEAKQIYTARYVAPFAWVPCEAIQAQLVDFGVTSGQQTALKALQRVLGVIPDGLAGEQTKTALGAAPWKLTQQALVAQRVQHYTQIVEQDDSQRVFLFGWIRRAISFLEGL